MQLDRNVRKTKTVKYLRLANEIPDPQEGTKCLVAGWGAVNPKEFNMSDSLMSAKVTVIKRKTCNSPEYYNSKPVITPEMVCAGTLGKKFKITDICMVTIIITIMLYYYVIIFIIYIVKYTMCNSLQATWSTRPLERDQMSMIKPT